MSRKISQEIVDKIPQLYEEFHNKSEVARQLNISVATVNKYLNIDNINNINDTNREHKRKITDEEIDQINSLYKETYNMAEVARKMKISASTVQKYLSEENKKLKEKINDDRDALWYYIYRLFGQADAKHPVSVWNITQMNKFKNQGYSYKAQLLTLKYFYEIKKNSTKKANGSIGIIPWVFEESRAYYESVVDQQEKINKAIQEQLERDRIEIQYNPSDYIGNKKKKKQIDLTRIAGDDIGSN